MLINNFYFFDFQKNKYSTTNEYKRKNDRNYY